jgi:preprotein translocase subunit SecB
MKLSVFIKNLEKIKRRDGDMDVFLDLDWGSEILDDITFETVLNVWNNTKKGEEVKELHINTFF